MSSNSTSTAAGPAEACDKAAKEQRRREAAENYRSAFDAIFNHDSVRLTSDVLFAAVVGIHDRQTPTCRYTVRPVVVVPDFASGGALGRVSRSMSRAWRRFVVDYALLHVQAMLRGSIVSWFLYNLEQMVMSLGTKNAPTQQESEQLDLLAPLYGFRIDDARSLNDVAATEMVLRTGADTTVKREFITRTLKGLAHNDDIYVWDEEKGGASNSNESSSTSSNNSSDNSDTGSDSNDGYSPLIRVSKRAGTLGAQSVSALPSFLIDLDLERLVGAIEQIVEIPPLPDSYSDLDCVLVAFKYNMPHGMCLAPSLIVRLAAKQLGMSTARDYLRPYVAAHRAIVPVRYTNVLGSNYATQMPNDRRAPVGAERVVAWRSMTRELIAIAAPHVLPTPNSVNLPHTSDHAKVYIANLTLRLGSDRDSSMCTLMTSSQRLVAIDLTEAGDCSELTSAEKEVWCEKTLVNIVHVVDAALRLKRYLLRLMGGAEAVTRLAAWPRALLDQRMLDCSLTELIAESGAGIAEWENGYNDEDAQIEEKETGESCRPTINVTFDTSYLGKQFAAIRAQWKHVQFVECLRRVLSCLPRRHYVDIQLLVGDAQTLARLTEEPVGGGHGFMPLGYRNEAITQSIETELEQTYCTKLSSSGILSAADALLQQYARGVMIRQNRGDLVRLSLRRCATLLAEDRDWVRLAMRHQRAAVLQPLLVQRGVAAIDVAARNYMIGGVRAPTRIIVLRALRWRHIFDARTSPIGAALHSMYRSMFDTHQHETICRTMCRLTNTAVIIDSLPTVATIDARQCAPLYMPLIDLTADSSMTRVALSVIMPHSLLWENGTVAHTDNSTNTTPAVASASSASSLLAASTAYRASHTLAGMRRDQKQLNVRPLELECDYDIVGQRSGVTPPLSESPPPPSTVRRHHSVTVWAQRSTVFEEREPRNEDFKDVWARSLWRNRRITITTPSRNTLRTPLAHLPASLARHLVNSTHSATEVCDALFSFAPCVNCGDAPIYEVQWSEVSALPMLMGTTVARYNARRTDRSSTAAAEDDYGFTSMSKVIAWSTSQQLQAAAWAFRTMQQNMMELLSTMGTDAAFATRVFRVEDECQVCRMPLSNVAHCSEALAPPPDTHLQTMSPEDYEHMLAVLPKPPSVSSPSRDAPWKRGRPPWTRYLASTTITAVDDDGDGDDDDDNTSDDDDDNGDDDDVIIHYDDEIAGRNVRRRRK